MVQLTLIGFLFLTLSAFASDYQMVEVTAEKAEIVRDLEKKKVIGVIRKGKTFPVTESSSERYYKLKSRKTAFIKKNDVVVTKSYRTKKRISLSYVNFASTIDVSEKNGKISSGDSLVWDGIAVKYEWGKKPFYDQQIIARFSSTVPISREQYSALEVGYGALYHFFYNDDFRLSAGGEADFIPIGNYSFKDDFRVNSYGYSLAVGVNGLWKLSEDFGIEVYAQYARMSFFNFPTPSPYQEISPVFQGVRAGIGLNLGI